MLIILWLVIGLIAGVTANALAGPREHRLFVDLAVGLIASLVGGFIFLSLK